MTQDADDTTHSYTHGSATVPGNGPPRRDRLRVVPPLTPGDLVFLAGFGRHPVPDHDGSPAALPLRLARIWPGQPAGPSPWVPCATGCCLHLAGRSGGPAAAQWLRFLLAEFLEPAHVLSGTVEAPGPAPGHARTRAVLIVDRAEVFEGEIDTGAGPVGRERGLGSEEPWSG
jgi:hypothetical protein